MDVFVPTSRHDKNDLANIASAQAHLATAPSRIGR
jgi:hypothetical protein